LKLWHASLVRSVDAACAVPVQVSTEECQRFGSHALAGRELSVR